ncbi:MAG: hypothetical protein ACETVN_00325 [Asgard group archaeon]
MSIHLSIWGVRGSEREKLIHLGNLFKTIIFNLAEILVEKVPTEGENLILNSLKKVARSAFVPIPGEIVDYQVREFFQTLGWRKCVVEFDKEEGKWQIYLGAFKDLPSINLKSEGVKSVIKGFVLGVFNHFIKGEIGAKEIKKKGPMIDVGFEIFKEKTTEILETIVKEKEEEGERETLEEMAKKSIFELPTREVLISIREILRPILSIRECSRENLNLFLTACRIVIAGPRSGEQAKMKHQDLEFYEIAKTAIETSMPEDVGHNIGLEFIRMLVEKEEKDPHSLIRETLNLDTPEVTLTVKVKVFPKDREDISERFMPKIWEGMLEAITGEKYVYKKRDCGERLCLLEFKKE